jgi:peptidoglycan L-alanyl-D-glutamate endopeptidase CwlK
MKQSTNTIKNLNLLQNDVKNIFETLLGECYKQGINAQISESIRTEARQLELYNSGKSKAKEVYQSLHFYGLACDIFVNNSGKYDLSQNEKIWKICQNLKLDIEHGMTWGGNFKSIKDQPHFELSWGKSWKFFYQEWKKKQQNTTTTQTKNPLDTILSEWHEFMNFYIS